MKKMKKRKASEGREPKGSETQWQRPAWEKKWEPFETPSFIRRNKQASLRKHPHE